MKVFIAEDQFLLRQGLEQLLRAHGIDVVGSAESGEVLALMAEGLANPVIAERLFVTDKAVQKHINSIFTKLDLPESGSTARRVQAVLTYLRQD